MSGSTNNNKNTSPEQKKFKGVRRRKWGKWVSEIRVPGSQERLWLGSYSSAEAAAVAHDVASYCLRGDSGLNFPLMLPKSVRADMSPKSIQKAASDAGMAIDAQMILSEATNEANVNSNCNNQNNLPQYSEPGWDDFVGNWNGSHNQNINDEEDLSISVEDYF